MAQKLGLRLAVCLVALGAAVRGDVGLRFVHSPEPITAPVGDEVTFECSLSVPAEQVRWRHDGRFLNHSVFDPKKPGKHNLNVRVNSSEQAGDYQVTQKKEERNFSQVLFFPCRFFSVSLILTCAKTVAVSRFFLFLCLLTYCRM